MFVLGYDVYVRRAGCSNILLLKKNYGYSEKETTETFAQARLHLAAIGGRANVVVCLIDEFNCSPDTKGFNGRTAIHHACESENVELVEMLLTKYNLDESITERKRLQRDESCV